MKAFTWEEYLENVKKVGCCPCGYIVHDYLSANTHWDLHRRLGEVKDGKLIVKWIVKPV